MQGTYTITGGITVEPGAFLDAAVCFAALSTNVFWPGPANPGLLRMPDLSSPMIATIGAGLRLSPPICVLAGALNLLSMGVLIAIDRDSGKMTIDLGPAGTTTAAPG